MIEYKVLRRVQGQPDSFEFEERAFLDSFPSCSDVTTRDLYLSSPDMVKFCLGIGVVSAQVSEEADLSTLRDVYEFADGDVAQFLKQNAFLVELLNEAIAKIKECFGPDTTVRVELTRESDSENHCEVFARITTTLKPKEALRILDRFDEEWWFDTSPRAKCLLNFALRYI